MRIIIGKSLKEIVPSSNCHIQDTKEVGYPPSRWESIHPDFFRLDSKYKPL